MEKSFRRIAWLIGLGLLLVSITALACDFNTYWMTYRAMFIEWKDPHSPEKTQVAGVRCCGEEKWLGGGDYNFSSVDKMREFMLSMEEQETFLREEGLGPYRAEGSRP